MTDREPVSIQEDSQPYLKIEQLTKKFGDFVALQEISLDVYEGEFICFLGPSGCGKTTLLRCIAGLDIQTHGRVVQAEIDISKLPPTVRDFGIVFQSYARFSRSVRIWHMGWKTGACQKKPLQRGSANFWTLSVLLARM